MYNVYIGDETMLNFVLYDSSLTYLNSLEKALNKLILKNNFLAKIEYKSTNVSDVLKYINKNKVHVLFLNSNGIEIAKKIRAIDKNIYIIFITSHKEYTPLAFEVKAFDYLPKKLTLDRLEKTLTRLFDDISSSSSTFIPLNNKTFISEDDIYYIRKDGMKAIFKTCNNTFKTYSSFNKLFEKLPDNFVRCHKSYIANINNISRIELGDSTVFFDDNEKCYIGPKYKDNLIEAVGIK